MRIAALILMFATSTAAVSGDAGVAVPKGSDTDRALPTDARQDDGAGQKIDPGRTFRPVKHPGRNVELRVAAKALIPRGCWRMEIERGLADTRVSWGTGPRWPEVVRRMADYAGLAAHFNYQDCRVGIGSDETIARRIAINGLHGVPVSSRPGRKVASASDDAVSGADPAPADGAVHTWELEPGYLREQLQRWVEKEAGWTLVWESARNPVVDAPATIRGTFREALGKVESAPGVNLEIERWLGNQTVVVKEP